MDSQNGIRKDSSCADHLSTLAEIVNTRKQKGLSTYVSFDWSNDRLVNSENGVKAGISSVIPCS